MVLKVAVVDLPCKGDNFWKWFEISRLPVVIFPTFLSSLRFQTGLSSLRVSSKHALKMETLLIIYQEKLHGLQCTYLTIGKL